MHLIRHSLRVNNVVFTCSSPKPDVAPLPVIDRLEWGPGHDLARVGLTALTHTEGHVEVNAGETQLRFKAEKDVQVIVDSFKTGIDMTGSERNECCCLKMFAGASASPATPLAGCLRQ